MKRTNTAKWYESRKRWQINVQKNGVRKTFTSSIPGRNGKYEANRKADEWLDGTVICGTTSVSALWTRHLARVKATTGTSNYNSVHKWGENYILPCIGKMKIAEVTEGDLQAIIDKAYRKGCLNKDKKTTLKAGETLSRESLQQLSSNIKKFIKYCRIYEHATKLYPENIVIPKGSRRKGRKILQPAALAELFTVDTTIFRGKPIFDDYIHAYRFQVAMGMRPGELVGLCVGDVKGDEVSIHRAVNYFGEITEGKNEDAVRSFTMTQQAKEAYKAQMKLLKDSGIEINYSTQLFQIKSQRYYYYRFSKYLEANDIAHVSPYELRHTFVSICKYLPEGQVKAVVGHSKNMDTFGQYGHYINGEKEETAASITGIFDKVLSNA